MTHPIFQNLADGMMVAQRLQSPGLTPPQPSGCPSCAAAEAQCDRMAQRIRELEAALALEVKARVACAEIAHEAKLALAKAEGDATSLLFLLAQIREAVGDNGKRMQNELVEYCRDLRRSKGTIQAALGNGADEAAWEPGEHWADAAARKIRAALEDRRCTR